MLKHRPEIDGLRAVAVLPVILFHAGFAPFAGGYIGVDVFFVISGYLITTIIIKEKESGTFTLLGFYERRARRILPALILVILCCLPFAWFWMLPYQLEGLARGIVAVSLFSSNFLFWWEQGYFSDAAELNPILHTWSLAVEEQYYILFPLLLLLAWPLGKRWLIGLFCAGALASLLLAQMGGHLRFPAPYVEPVFRWFWQPSWASFYLPVGRAWELLLGGMVAMYLHTRPHPDGPANQIAATAGLLLIAASVAVFDEKTPFPSFHTLLPTAGTALVLVFATSDTIVAKMLSLRVVAGLGLVSYSAYLWHQPVFAFARLRVGEPGAWVFGILIAASLLLAYFSWRYVELPFRNKSRVSGSQLVAAVGVSTVMLMSLSAAMITSDGGIERYAARDRHLVQTSPEQRANYVTARFNTVRGLAFSQAPTKKIAIVGDSFAQDFVNMAVENGYLSDYEIRTVFVPVRCQLYMGDEDPSVFSSQEDRQLCADHMSLADARDLIQEADIVVFAVSWYQWAVERLPETIESLELGERQRLVVIGSKYFGKPDVRSFVGTDSDFRQAARNRVERDINGLLREKLGQDGFVDIQRLVCEAGNLCPVFTPEGDLISHDGGHLTKGGAKFVGEIVFKHPLLSDLRGRRAPAQLATQ